MSEPRTFLNGRVTLYASDCRDVLKGMADNSIDSVCCDPPYHLQSIVKRFGGKNAAPAKHGTDGAFKRASAGFMSKTWDGGDIAFQPELWAEVLRVLKPGGYIMSFSSCRTYHRMACAIEDAGFITHPFFAWAFGSGFPKAHNLSKQIDREFGAERTKIRVDSQQCRNPKATGGGKDGMVGATRPWIEAAKINGFHEKDSEDSATDAAREWNGWFYGTQSCKPAIEPVYFGQKPFEQGLNGAQNVLKWGVGAINVAACKIGTREAKLTTSTGEIISENFAMSGGNYGRVETGEISIGRWPANLIHDGSEEVLACFPDARSAGIYGNEHNKSEGMFGTRTGGSTFDDSGSAARFFASFPQDDIQRIFYTSKAGADDRLGSKHPTVKPLDLIQYLVRLITPKNGVCLDLFAGTGTTAEACFREGFRAILIEREAEYIKDIERRMSLVMEGHDMRKYASMKARNRPRDDGPLFGGSEESPHHPRPTGCIRNGAEGPFGYDGKSEATE